MTKRNDASEAQVRAARPDASTWLAANAGSGKTRVLTDRVARLLLNAVQPQHILCLTYTKAAASEMQNRLFDRLGQWAMLDDDALGNALVDLGAQGQIDAEKLRDARTLFARAIETPGGLKIQTIHSFCASLLRRFPLEAKVSPQFTEIEDRAAELLRAEIVDQMADGPGADLVADIARHHSDQDFNKLTRAIVSARDSFDLDLDIYQALAIFKMPKGLTKGQIERGVFNGNEAELIAQILPAMFEKGGRDGTEAANLATISNFDFNALPTLEKSFLFAGGKTPGLAKIGTLPTKPTQKILADQMPKLDALMQRVETARAQRLGLLAAEKTLALHQFAIKFIKIYEQQKLLRGWLDFDDLILKARMLLTDPAVAAWVLYRIDGGIDHILVDEAQDTSPAQWDVIRKLAAEFSSGDGARSDVARTLFVVGDKKQSIYSFQGADPREFDRMQEEFKHKLQGAGHPFQDLTLDYSFRSSDAILRLVDTTFTRQSEAGFIQDALHVAFKGDLPGRVDLWPPIDNETPTDERHWSDPIDQRSPAHNNVVLADQIASQIKHLIDSGQTIPDEDQETKTPIRRRITPGDILILVQKRSGIFGDIIRACKAHRLPIAGADRLKIGAELAVRDLAALLNFLAVPEDSLSLATALRSPLFGWSEQALFDLAHRRTDPHLWQELRGKETLYPDTYTVLRDLRDNIDFLRPYDLIERVLTRHKGRRNLLARLGPEAEDGINALLAQALAFERSAVPSLTGFLIWLATDDVEIKRQIDSASDQIRVMTAHGAKGLEAPIVILPETGSKNSRVSSEIINMDGTPVWKQSSALCPDNMATALEDIKDSAQNEYLRLLYVALTRAEKWLIVAAAGKIGKTGTSWYELVQAAMLHSHAAKTTFGGIDILRMEHGDWEALPLAEQDQPPTKTAQLPDFYNRIAPPVAAPTATISPSMLEGAKALSGMSGKDEETAKAYGTLVHLALERLAPYEPDDRAKMIPHIFPQDPAQSQQHQLAISEAMTVLSAPHLAQFFGPESLAEVSISANLGAQRIHGAIDRLMVGDDRVLAIDFKSNAIVPETPQNCPIGLLRQMGAYAHALAQIYPDRHIETAIIWTANASLMPLDPLIVQSALESMPYLDEEGPDT